MQLKADGDRYMKEYRGVLAAEQKASQKYRQAHGEWESIQLAIDEESYGHRKSGNITKVRLNGRMESMLKGGVSVGYVI